MFDKSCILVVISVVAIQASVVPFDLIDDAKEDLEALRQTVLGAILAAENNLDDFSLDLQSFASNTERSAIVTVQSEREAINNSLTVLKNLAHSAEADISYCLDGRENYLSNLHITILADLNDCVFGKIVQGSIVLREIKYLIDININSVNALEFQLELCEAAGDPCITVLIQEIELATERVPQQIKVEVLKAEELFGELKISVQECADLKISQYVTTANTILDDITQCVDAIIG
ncbi:uncharacterized protein LOC135126512 [Zophobas morio]|uniref:uncharacterized protein LOC135126512 n=1 Tax=Zophobas morio TaxID=2755281 RepID=UPI0030835A5B